MVTFANGIAALAFVIAAAWLMRRIAQRIDRFSGPAAGPVRTLELAIVGWLDWLLAMIAFTATIRATGLAVPLLTLADTFFFGQLIGLVKIWRGSNIAVETPVYAAESVGAGSTVRRAIDGASELVIGMFRAGAEKL